MPFTDSLGAELLLLDQGAIDAIATLRSNLAQTRARMEDVSKEARMGLLGAAGLSNALAHDLGLLLDVFTHIAPNRRIKLDDDEPKLVTNWLTEEAGAV